MRGAPTIPTWLAVLVILIGIPFLIPATILMIREAVVLLKLSWSGVKVDGCIIDHYKESKPRKYYLTYDYVYHGSSYSRREEVRSHLYNKLNNGDKVSVICLPEHPKTARLGDEIPDTMVGKGIEVALILIGIVVVIFLLAIAIMVILSGILFFFNSN